MSDWLLLRQYVNEKSEAAFSSLVDRHMKMVYWTCRRDLHSVEMAEDAAQAVFILLARKAAGLRSGVSISGWLFNTARLVARNVRRDEALRRRHEEEAMVSMETAAADSYSWEDVEPVLNDALGALKPADRAAILMRYCDGFSMKEVAVELGLTEDTAGKRIARAVQKMQRALAGKGVAIPVATLGAILAAHSAKAAVPPGLHASAMLSVSQLSGGQAPASVGANTRVIRLQRGGHAAMQAAARTSLGWACAAGVVVAVCVAVVLPLALRAGQRPGPDFTSTFIDAAPAPTAGDPAASARTEIMADYADIGRRTAMRELAFADGFYAPDFTATFPGDRTLNLTQVIQANQQSMAALRTYHMTVTLQNWNLDGSTMTVTSTAQIAGRLTETGLPPGGVPFTEDRVGTNVWEKRSGRWMAIRAQITSDTSTLNGQPIPAARS